MKKLKTTFKELKTFKLKDLSYQHITAGIVIIFVIVLGIHFIISSFAASPFSSIGASSGKLGTSGSATVQTCASGATGQCVQFGSATPPILAVHIKDGQLVNGQGQPIRLLGVDASGTEDACILGDSLDWHPLGDSKNIAENASEDATYANAMTTWNINAVRVPLNEDCWLGINGAPLDFTATEYQDAIQGWVTALNNAGIVVILSLVWSAPGTNQALQEWPMPDENNSPNFWTSVATTFKSDPAVIFDPFGEPFMDSSHPTDSDWSCWLKGSTVVKGQITSCPGTFTPKGATSQVTYAIAGMQQLITTIRNTGASQPIIVGGLNWSGDPCGLDNAAGSTGSATNCSEIANMPTDPDNQLALSLHSYSWTPCNNLTCWSDVAQAAKAANLPIVTGEIGEDDCTDNYIKSYIDWADQNDVSYLDWSWELNAYSACTPGLSTTNANLELLSNWNGTPASVSGEAAYYKSHLLSITQPTP
jgi:hypothetical protein